MQGLRMLLALGLMLGWVQVPRTQAPLWTSGADARDMYGEGDVAVDAAGNVYLLSSAYGFAGERFKGDASGWGVIKYSPQGVKLWTRVMGESESSFARGAAVGPQGSVYVVGRMLGASIAKFDNAGERKWFLHARQFDKGDHSNSVFRDVIVDREGNAYATGSTTMDLNDSEYVGQGLLLAKYTSDGKLAWKRRFDVSQSEATSIARDAQGNLYMAGNASADWDGQKNHGGIDYILLKCNSAGERIWVRQYGGSLTDFGVHVSVDDAGIVFSVGYANHDRKDSINAGGYDVTLYKHDKDGNLIFAKPDGRVNFSPRYHAYAPSPEGSLYGTLVAMVKAPTKKDKTDGKYQTFLVKYGPDGEKIWSSPIGRENFGLTEGTAVDGQGSILLACGTSDPRRNSEDACVAKFAPYAPSFDCLKASTAQERLICGSKVLSDLDVTLSLLYSAALKSASDGAGWKADQVRWVKTERNLCVTEEKLQACLLDRIEVLRNGRLKK